MRKTDGIEGKGSRRTVLAGEEQTACLMEGIKTLYCPGFIRLTSIAKSGKIGEIKCVEASFTKLGPLNVREMKAEEAGGSMTELASYPLAAILKLLGENYKEIRFSSLIKNGVDLFTKIDINYDNAVATARWD
jgi:predicted dehydrogenase